MSITHTVKCVGIAFLAGAGLAGWIPGQKAPGAGANAEMYGRYDASPVVMNTGTWAPVLLDSTRRLQVNIAAINSQTVVMEVQGTTEDGTAPVSTEDQPVLIGGMDQSTGLVQTIGTTSTGDVSVVSSGIVEDGAHLSGERGFLTLGVRNDSRTILAGVEGDRIPFSTTNSGAVYVGAEGVHAIDSPLTIATERPVSIGGRASTASPTSTSADNDLQGFWLTRDGAQRVVGGETATVDTTARAADVQLVAANAGNRVVWYSIRESGAPSARATVALRHGTLATDPAITYIELLQDESREPSIPLGLPVPNGVFLDIIAGQVDITIWTEDHQP